jgi:hypothetical protein
MSTAKEKILASFWLYNEVLSVFGLVQLKPLKTILSIVLTRIQLIFFAGVFVWFLFTNNKLTNISVNDPIVEYCQYIDKSSMTACISLTFIEAIIFKKRHFRLFAIMSDIDGLLEKSLNLKVNYKRVATVTYAVLCLNLCTFLGFARRLFEEKMSTEKFYYLIIFILGTFLILYYESYYSAIVLQSLFRFNLLKKFLSSDYSNVHKESVNEIFMKTHRVIAVINDEFGIFILLATVKHFIRVTTRVYMVFHILNFNVDEQYLLYRKSNFRILSRNLFYNGVCLHSGLLSTHLREHFRFSLEFFHWILQDENQRMHSNICQSSA